MSDKIIKSSNVKLVDQKENVADEFIKTDFESGEDDTGKGMSKIEVIQAEAKTKIEIAKNEAYERGLSEGKREGVEIEKNRLSLTLNTFTSLMEELAKLKEKTLEGFEEEILNLSVSIAEKVIHREVSTEKDVVLSVVKEAIKSILDREEMKIRLNPADYNYMMEVDPGILSSFGDVRSVAFEEDEGIEPGGAIIETLFGEVDARLDKQLDEIKNGLKAKG